MAAIRSIVKRIPLVGPLAIRTRRAISKVTFRSSDYWERLYQHGGTSGPGSYGELAAFKADVMNEIVSQNGIQTVIEFGCGDGNQLRHMRYPNYLGVDVAQSAVERCRELHKDDPTKRFSVIRADGEYGQFDMAISLDVIYHLVEDSVFESYMRSVCAAATRVVVFYSSNGDPLNGAVSWSPHVRHRRFTDWMDWNRPDWKLVTMIPNRYPFRHEGELERGSFADFYVFEKAPGPT